MRRHWQHIILVAVLMIFLVSTFGALIWLVFPKLDPMAAGIAGTLAGTLIVTLSQIISSVLGIWDRSRDLTEKIKDRVSDHALQLTKMDYELCQKSLELQKEKRDFLRPIKVYRELYKALLELHEKGTWPKNIEELGLLNIFPLGVDKQDEKIQK